MENSVSSEIMQLFADCGNQMYGEQVTQLSHAVQAGLIAKSKGLDEELILAAFLHDIGHIVPLAQKDPDYERMGELGVEQHDLWGEQFLKERSFSVRIIACVKNHVAAKRYLCAIDPQYYQELSQASKETLSYQGGPMKPEALALFKRDPFYKDSLLIRRIDEAAKEIDYKISEEDLAYFQGLLEKMQAK